MIRVFLNGSPINVASVADLRDRLTVSCSDQFSEYMLVEGELPKHCLSVLRNGDAAVLFYTLNIDEESHTSRNPNTCDGTKETEFTLSNGQVDAYDTTWVVATDAAFDTLCHFFQHRTLGSVIDWHRDF